MNAGDRGVDQGRRLKVACLHNPAPTDIAAGIAAGAFTWIDLEGANGDQLDALARAVPLHSLTRDDAQEFRQRPRFREFESKGYVYLVVYGVEGTTNGMHELHEVHMIVSGDAIVTIHQRPFRPLDELREQYGDETVRSEQFLVWAVLDAITGTFLPVVEDMEEMIDSLDNDVLTAPDDAQLRRIVALRGDLAPMRRQVTAMRDMLHRNVDSIAELPGLEADERLYFRDLYDNLARTSDSLDGYRDVLSDATDLYMSTVATRQGDVNRQLTIIATIFLPLTFLTGFFGQNFAELTNHIIDTEWSFWVFGIGLLFASVLGFVVYFKKRGWLS